AGPHRRRVRHPARNAAAGSLRRPSSHRFHHRRHHRRRYSEPDLLHLLHWEIAILSVSKVTVTSDTLVSEYTVPVIFYNKVGSSFDPFLLSPDHRRSPGTSTAASAT